jgi:hypothetical protein
MKVSSQQLSLRNVITSAGQRAEGECESQLTRRLTQKPPVQLELRQMRAGDLPQGNFADPLNPNNNLTTVLSQVKALKARGSW